VEIRAARIPQEVPALRALFREYAAGIGIDLCFQRFEEEIEGLPGLYAPPEGRLLLACEDDDLVGCAALRPLADGLCEMKRLYVRPAHRGKGAGGRLVRRLLDEAAAAGYARVVLDTLPSMREAIKLYRSLGFVETGVYYAAAPPDAVFFSRELGSA
jgi:ribosomal protein S18 acetylase RimI-like enzyme